MINETLALENAVFEMLNQIGYPILGVNETTHGEAWDVEWWDDSREVCMIGWINPIVRAWDIEMLAAVVQSQAEDEKRYPCGVMGVVICQQIDGELPACEDVEVWVYSVDDGDEQAALDELEAREMEAFAWMP